MMTHVKRGDGEADVILKVWLVSTATHCECVVDEDRLTLTIC